MAFSVQGNTQLASIHQLLTSCSSLIMSVHLRNWVALKHFLLHGFCA